VVEVEAQLFRGHPEVVDADLVYSMVGSGMNVLDEPAIFAPI
jgi:hypothetical protein